MYLSMNISMYRRLLFICLFMNACTYTYMYTHLHGKAFGYAYAYILSEMCLYIYVQS